MEFKKVQELVFETYKEKGWQKLYQNKKDLNSILSDIALITCELSEAVEEIRNGKGTNTVYYNEDKPTKPEGFGIELADAVIRIMNVCNEYNIDLEELILLKNKYNETRDYMHGKKI